MNKKLLLKKLNKKAQVQYFLESAFRIGFLMIALLVFFLLVNFFIVNKIEVNKLQSEVVANRIMYSDTIMYTENSRVYFGIIDMNKFNDETLSEKIDYSIQRHAAVRMILINNTDGASYPPVYLNKDAYEKLEVLLPPKVTGKGSATKYEKVFPVTYKEGTTYKYGTLKMQILIPNS